MAGKNSVGLGVQAQPEPFVDADAVASFLSVERRQVLQMARRGIIPAHPLIGQGNGARCMWRFRLSEVADAVSQTGESGFTSLATRSKKVEAVPGSKIGEKQ